VRKDVTLPSAPPFPANNSQRPSTTLLSSDTACFDHQSELAELDAAIAAIDQLPWPN